jgi:hypothetical protein
VGTSGYVDLAYRELSESRSRSSGYSKFQGGGPSLLCMRSLVAVLCIAPSRVRRFRLSSVGCDLQLLACVA